MNNLNKIQKSPFFNPVLSEMFPAVSLLDLTDVNPDTYNNQGGNVLVVNSNENGVDFVNAGSVIIPAVGLGLPTHIPVYNPTGLPPPIFTDSNVAIIDVNMPGPVTGTAMDYNSILNPFSEIIATIDALGQKLFIMGANISTTGMDSDLVILNNSITPKTINLQNNSNGTIDLYSKDINLTNSTNNSTIVCGDNGVQMVNNVDLNYISILNGGGILINSQNGLSITNNNVNYNDTTINANKISSVFGGSNYISSDLTVQLQGPIIDIFNTGGSGDYLRNDATGITIYNATTASTISLLDADKMRLTTNSNDIDLVSNLALVNINSINFDTAQKVNNCSQLGFDNANKITYTGASVDLRANGTIILQEDVTASFLVMNSSSVQLAANSNKDLELDTDGDFRIKTLSSFGVDGQVLMRTAGGTNRATWQTLPSQNLCYASINSVPAGVLWDLTIGSCPFDDAVAGYGGFTVTNGTNITYNNLTHKFTVLTAGLFNILCIINVNVNNGLGVKLTNSRIRLLDSLLVQQGYDSGRFETSVAMSGVANILSYNMQFNLVANLVPDDYTIDLEDSAGGGLGGCLVGKSSCVFQQIA